MLATQPEGGSVGGTEELCGGGHSLHLVPTGGEVLAENTVFVENQSTLL